MAARTELFINNMWRSGSGDRFASHCPATGDVLWEGKSATEGNVADTVAAARAAFPAWARTPFEERRDKVLAFKAALEARRTDIARLLAQEMGKPLWEAEGEVGAMIGKVDISLATYEERTGARETPVAFGRQALRHRPHGVMAVFGPYNFPGHLPNGHIVPALIAGNTVVFKPSEITPAAGAAMVEAWEAAGLPAGVINLVQGARDTGAALLKDDINGVLFTGSVETGLMIHRQFAGRPDVILALELGGNNPLVVWDAADAEAVASIALQSAFITSGQRCSCARRLIVPEGAAGDAMIEALLALLDRVRIGAWDAQPEPFMGPLVTEQAASRVLTAETNLRELGGQVLRPVQAVGPRPTFLAPGLIDMTSAGAVPDKEIFGPLLQVFRVPSFDAALERANDTEFGLAAGLVSDDPALWDRFALDIRAGVVNWNRPTTGASSALPFGGPGLSGDHRPSAAYAADYCAYPMASQEAESVERLTAKGLA